MISWLRDRLCPPSSRAYRRGALDALASIRMETDPGPAGDRIRDEIDERLRRLDPRD